MKGRRGSVVVRVRVQISICLLELLTHNNKQATSAWLCKKGILGNFGYSMVTYMISVQWSVVCPYSGYTKVSQPTSKP